MQQTKTYLKAFKFPIYPKGDQIGYLAKNFGCSRYVFNKVLELREKPSSKKVNPYPILIPPSYFQL